MRSAKFSKIVIFTVCILLVFAVAAALLFDGASLPASGNVIADSGEGADKVAEASYPVSADGYTHGSNIGRATSGTVYDVSNASDLATRISNNQNIRLTGPITVTSFNASSYSGTIYGNGQTVTINYTSELSTGASENEGGVVGTLTGSIYDLNVVVQSNTTIKRGRNAYPSTYNMGIIAGNINGGTISNCAVTINSGVTIWAFSWRSGDYASFGGVVGRVTSGTISNVTVTNNGSIKAGNAKDGNVSDVNNEIGVASNVAGYINNNSASLTISLSNIIVAGSGTISSYVAANIGLNVSSGKAVNVQNFYNKFTGTYKYATLSGGVFGSDTPLVAYTIFKWSENSDGSTVTNYYASGADESMMKTGFFAVPDSSVEVGSNYSIYFDPKANSIASSLVVVKTGVTGGEGYSATIANVKSTPFVYTNNYAFSADGRTVIFRNLSTTASDWSSGGNFACTINITQDAIQVDKLDPVNKWESSYTTSQSSSGTAVDNGSKLTTAIKNNDQNIYLTSDITDFKGFTHTGEYTGTLDGNGHTIYIVSGAANSADTVGGLFKRLSGTIKNVRIVLYSSYNRTISAGSIGTGIIAGNLCGGTVDNVYVYVPSDVTFGANGGSNYESYVGAVAGLSDAGYTIKNTTVDIDGEIRLDGSWIYLSAFIGKSQSSTTQYNYNFTNVTFRGNGSFNNDYCKDSEEPIFLGGATVLFTSGSSGNAKLNIDGFINDFQGSVAAQNYSMYGILTQNQKTGTLAGWTINTANVYDYDTPLADINKTTTGNKYIEITSRSTVSTTAEGSSIKVTPYFPAGDTTNLVLVAGDGSQSVPDLAYGDYKSTTDGNYKVVTVPKSAISAGSTVELSEKKVVSDPSISTTAENLVYNGGEITVEINQLMSGTTALGESDYTVVITANGGNALVQNGKPVNAGEYTLTVTLRNGYKFEGGTTKKTIAFTVTPFVISGSLSVSGSAVYDKTEKTVIFTADENKGLFNGDNVVISYNDGDRVNVTEAGFVATATVPNGNYTFADGDSISATLNITAKQLTVVWGETQFEYSGEAQAPTATATGIGQDGNLDITLTIKNAQGEVVEGGAVNAGTYSAEATTDNGNYTLTNENKDFEITQKAITVGVTVDGWTYGDTAKAPVVSGNDGNGEVTYLYTGTEYSDAVAPQNAGTYSLEITVAETANYQGGKASCEFTIEKAVVTVPTIEDKAYTGEILTADIVDTDEYEVVENNGGRDVATYDVVIRLKDAANYKWSDGTQTADITLEFHIVASGNSWINKPEITGWTYGQYSAETNAPVYEAAYGNDNVEKEVRLKSGSDSDYVAVEDLSTLNAGVYLMKFTVAAVIDPDGGESYTSLSAVVEFTVSKAAIKVTVDIISWTYGDEANAPSVDGNTAGGKVTYSYVGTGNTAYEESETAPVNAGTYKVKATVAETTNYLGATAEAEFTIAKKAITATVSAENATYDGIERAATVSFDGKVGEDELTASLLYNGEAEAPVNAGSYTVTVASYGGAAVANYDITTSEKEVVLVISPKELTIDDIVYAPVDESDDGIYDGEAHAITASVNSGSLCGEDIVTLRVLYNGYESAPVNAGTYTVTFASANGNYAVDESVSYEMTVAKANVNAPKANELVYNGTEQIAFSENSLYTAGGVIAATDVSEEGYTATFTLTSDNYKWSNEGDEVRKISVKWNIAPYSVTIEISEAAKTKVYNGVALTEEELKALFVAPEKLDGGKVEIVVTVKDGGEVLNVGEYTVTAELNDRNYVADKAETTFTVTQATPKVTVKVQDKLLQEGDKLSTVGIYLEEGSTPGTVSWEDTELALKKGENVVAWTYVPEDKLNYTGATGSLTLTVGDEVLTAFEMTKGPDKTEYNAFEAFDPTGIELMATFDGVHEQAVAIDECEIVVENATADGKLTAATTKVTVEYGNMSVEIAVSVAKIKVEIPALEQTEFEYTAQPHTVAVAEDPRYTIVEGNEETNVGRYNAVVSLTDKVNYEWADGSAEDRMLSWEITPVTLSGYITLPENLVYDGVAKVATFTLTKGELLGGATMNIAYELTDGTVLQGAPVDAGVYEVVATLPDTKNYRFEEGTEYCKAMTVEKKTVTIITIGSREKVYDGSEVTPEQLAEHFSATDGIAVKVTVSGTVLNAGTYQITATIEEKNYRAEPVSCTYTVRKASQTAEADISVSYLKVEITAADETAIVEYSEDGNVWKTLDGAITVGLKATYSYYVRYAESANYNASAAVKVEGNITKAALMQYVEERFTGDITLADAADIAMLEELAKSAEGQNADFDKVLESLSAQREELVNGATNAVEKALKAGGALKGYAAVATALAITVGGISAAAAVGLMIGKGKGGRKNEEK